MRNVVAFCDLRPNPLKRKCGKANSKGRKQVLPPLNIRQATFGQQTPSKRNYRKNDTIDINEAGKEYCVSAE